MTNPSLALYIHWPFCKSKCPYCDFNSHVREQVDYAAWERAYRRELAHFAPYLAGKRVGSVFFGGGTPSLMPPAIVAAILDTLTAYADIAPGLEVTLEANPTSVEAEKFRQFRAAGINRVSLGVQSLVAEDLAFLGREHSAGEAMRAIHLAQDTFPRYSFDLIYARPGQTLAAWEKELNQALKLVDKHLSLYQLTIEKGTAFYGQHKAGSFQIPEEELAAEFFELTETIMEAAGLPAYEISNHAVPGEECRHNLAYWRYDDYLGIGPGAHSRLTLAGKKTALMMLHQPEGWQKAVETQGHGLQQQEALTPDEHKEEMLLMGLRLKDGIPRSQFDRQLGKQPEQLFAAAILKLLQEEGLIGLDNHRLYATRKGMKLLNSVVREIIG